MATIISHSAEETLALGREWGQQVRDSMVFALSGELGAGKTQLVKGIALGLGIPNRVHSPTFALVNAYSGGRLPLFHLDLYRLESLDQILGAGLEEYLAPRGIVVIEWADRWPDLERRVPGRLRRTRLETLGPTERRISYEDSGA
jgi:tRNA threonylcarbamoyladenosine biosynthesis protein TsaE